MIQTGSIVTLKSDSRNQMFVVSFNLLDSSCSCIKWCNDPDVQDFIDLSFPKSCLSVVEGRNTSRDDFDDLIAGEVLQMRGCLDNRLHFTVHKGAAFDQQSKIEVVWFGPDGKLQKKEIRLIALTRVKPRPS